MQKTAAKIMTNPIKSKHVSGIILADIKAKDSVSLGQDRVWIVMSHITSLLEDNLQDWAKTREGIGYDYWR